MNGAVQIPYFDHWTESELGDYGWMAFVQSETCPFCLTDLEKVLEIDRYDSRSASLNELLDKMHTFHRLDARQCSVCGWWNVLYVIQNKPIKHFSTGYHSQALLKHTDISSMELPIAHLRSYLLTNEAKIYDIDPYKMEELVGSVMAEHFSCDVKYVGRSGDRGIDLLLVQGDDLTPIQVKRRKAASKTESVSVVRDLLGVMFRDQCRRGMIVTTADHFSKDAKRDVFDVISKGLIDGFDLIDVHRFISMLRECKVTNPCSFQHLVPKVLGGSLEGARPQVHALTGYGSSNPRRSPRDFNET